MKKKFFVFVAAMLGGLQFCYPAGVSAEGEKIDSYKEISSFRDYEWGSSIDQIKEGEITSDMQELTHYEIEPLDNTEMINLTIKNSAVAGYDASTLYIFSDDVLVGGAYTLDLIGDSEVDDVINKYSSVYGNPAVEKAVTEENSFFIWLDDNENKILIITNSSEGDDSGSDVIMYFQNESPLWNYYVNAFSGSDMDIEKELGKIGNTDGI